MVEMIPQADTLRKIQVEHGVTGSFKDRPLADWLQKHNPTDEQYDKVHTPGHTHTPDTPGVTPSGADCSLIKQ